MKQNVLNSSCFNIIHSVFIKKNILKNGGIFKKNKHK